MFGLVLVVSTMAASVPMKPPPDVHELIEIGYQKMMSKLDWIASIAYKKEAVSVPITVVVGKMDKPQPMGKLARLAATPQLDAMIQTSMARINDGSYTSDDIARVIAAHNTNRNAGELLRFCDRVQADSFDLRGPPGLRAWVAGQCARAQAGGL